MESFCDEGPERTHRRVPPHPHRKSDLKLQAAPMEPSVKPYIVGMGASAGGLVAFEHFFSHLPPDTGLAFVLVPHLEPTHKGMM
ncbi:MAG: chemotaxis protein CheB, partial [Thermoguttaceae bacterium]